MREQREQSQDPAVEVSEELDSSDDTDDEGLQLDGLLPEAVILPDMINKDRPILSQDAAVKVSEEQGSSNDTSVKSLKLDGLLPGAVILPDMINKD